MEKRSTRCNRDKKAQQKEAIKVAKSLTTGLAMCSLLITGTAQATGQTYSTFGDVERVNAQVSMCPVFPSTIEKKFSDLISHIEALLQIEKKIRKLPSMSITTHSPTLPENPSIDELEQLSKEIETAERSYQSQATQLKANQKEFQNLGKQIKKELQEIRTIVQDLKSYRHYDPNCLEVDKHQILLLFKEKITEAWSLHPWIIAECNDIADQYRTNSSTKRSFKAAMSGNDNWSEDFLQLEKDWTEKAQKRIDKLNDASQNLLRMNEKIEQKKEELKEKERLKQEEKKKQEELEKQKELDKQKENKEKAESPEETTKENTSDQPEEPAEKKEEKPKDKPKDDPPKEEKAPPAKKKEPKPSEPKKEKKEEPAPEPPKEKEKSETPPDKEEAKKEKPPEKAPPTKEEKKEKEDKKSDTED
ncbi:hypothetical protein H0266_08375 [Halobacillus locisalis]|uniref:DUF4047 domain-containing protein n=1 Tax=Halobacillus locisalis TaxID=220753 RepID=A0A838CTG3_9BACI|nr:hypothetical protein [Halobacillus locisalis]MBA2174906.1 hypothetical protein [Halobacillus locisalis]